MGEQQQDGPQAQPQIAEQDSMQKYNLPVMRSIEAEKSLSAATGIQRAMFIPQSYGEAIEIAKMMCAGVGVPNYLRGSPANCMAVLMQASRWGLDPYAVASKSYFVNDMIAYEAQLVNAVVNTSGALIGRPKIWWEGQDNGLRCFVEAQIRGDDETKILSQAFAKVKVKNSPLWQVNPEQQLAYFTSRAWARLYIPEVLLGVYTPDEAEVIERAPSRRREVERPAEDEPRPSAPRRSNFVAADQDKPPPDAAEESEPVESVVEPVEEKPVERTVGPVPFGFESWENWRDAVSTRLKIAPTLPKLDQVVRDTKDLFDAAPDDVREWLQDLYDEKRADHIAATQ